MLPTVAVIGAGAFGGWTALKLRESGARVTLFDLAGPGHGCSSSGDESRVFRHTYADLAMTRMAKRSRSLWLDYQTLWNTALYQETGLLWLVSTDSDDVEKRGLENLVWEEVDHEIITRGEIEKRFPLVNIDSVRYGFIEKPAGFLHARLACEQVVKAFESAGGEYRREKALPGTLIQGRLDHLLLPNGEHFQADLYLFACGSWLKTLFPDWLGLWIRPTRQEVFYFSVPDHIRFELPVWADHGEEFWYGIPDGVQRTFKIANDTRGANFDPDRSDRTISSEGLTRAREKMASRFPGLGDLALLDAKVCHYENSPDFGLLLDRHPDAKNLWALGGGSGHGFKHGPALGEIASAALLSGEDPPPFLSANRWKRPGG